MLMCRPSSSWHSLLGRSSVARVTPGVAAVLAACALSACSSRSQLWETSLNDMEAKIDRKVASSAAAGGDPARKNDDPNSLLARLDELDRASDEEQARMIARGIDAAVQLESGAQVHPQDTSIAAAPVFVRGVSRVWNLAELVAAALEANPVRVRIFPRNLASRTRRPSL